MLSVVVTYRPYVNSAIVQSRFKAPMAAVKRIGEYGNAKPIAIEWRVRHSVLCSTNKSYRATTRHLVSSGAW